MSSYGFSPNEQSRYDIDQLKGEMESMYDRINSLEEKYGVLVDDIALLLQIIDCFDLTDEQKNIVKNFYSKSNPPQ